MSCSQMGVKITFQIYLITYFSAHDYHLYSVIYSEECEMNQMNALATGFSTVNPGNACMWLMWCLVYFIFIYLLHFCLCSGNVSCMEILPICEIILLFFYMTSFASIFSVIIVWIFSVFIVHCCRHFAAGYCKSNNCTPSPLSQGRFITILHWFGVIWKYFYMCSIVTVSESLKRQAWFCKNAIDLCHFILFSNLFTVHCDKYFDFFLSESLLNYVKLLFKMHLLTIYS